MFEVSEYASQISRWLVTVYQMVFNKLPQRTNVYNANLFENQKLGNFGFKAISLFIWKVFIEKRHRNKRVFFLSWAMKSYLKMMGTDMRFRKS